MELQLSDEEIEKKRRIVGDLIGRKTVARKELRSEGWVTFIGTENLRYDITISPTHAGRFTVYYDEIYVNGGFQSIVRGGKHEAEGQPWRYSVHNRRRLEGYDIMLDPRFWYAMGGSGYLSSQALPQWLDDHEVRIIGKEELDGDLCYVLEDDGGRKFWIAPEKGYRLLKRVLKVKDGPIETRIYYLKYGENIWFPDEVVESGPNVHGWKESEMGNRRLIRFRHFWINEDLSSYFRLDIRPDEWVLDYREKTREFRRAADVLEEEFFKKWSWIKS
jgi:hypothetical protein